MRFIAIWDEGDSTEFTALVQRALKAEGQTDRDVAADILLGFYEDIVAREIDHKANREYGERHQGEFHWTGGGGTGDEVSQ